MEIFNPLYQERHNGPLTEAVRARLQRFRESGSTLQDIGNALGISGAFVSKLLNPKGPANISSIHIPRIMKTLEHHEQLNGFVPKTEQDVTTSSTKLENLPLEDLIRAISAKGFDVSVTPRTAR
jgi:predicted transcriptional regulator